MRRDPTAGLYPPGYEPVPTLPDLVARGLATVVPDPTGRRGPGTFYRPTPEGEALLRDTMRRNAERMRAWQGQR